MTQPQETSQASQLDIVGDAFADIAHGLVEKGLSLISASPIELDGAVIGHRLISAVNPTLQLVYVPQDSPTVAAFLFPGDDAAVVVDILFSASAALKRLGFEKELEVASVIAPVFAEKGVSFETDPEKVYGIFNELILQRADAIRQVHVAKVAEAAPAETTAVP